MGHAGAKLTLAGRRLLVERIEQEGWSAAVAAEAVGVARATAYPTVFITTAAMLTLLGLWVTVLVREPVLAG